MIKYRVFISYSHHGEDKVNAEKIEDILKKNGVCPILAKKYIPEGEPVFSESIKTLISHAHVFMPIITEESKTRGWVHQEIGYALAQNIPILPLTIGTEPGEMLQVFNAATLDKDLTNAKDALSYNKFKSLVEKYEDSSFALYRCAEYMDKRTSMLIEYSNEIVQFHFWGRVRQKGGLSSFHLPENALSNAVFSIRKGSEKINYPEAKMQREERRSLKNHADKKGCSLIIYPELMKKIFLEEYGINAVVARFKVLLEFLESMPDKKVVIALDHTEESEMNKSITIVGDWFAAESVARSARDGYLQTIFTRHAPNIQRKIKEFDLEMAELLENSEWTPENSRVNAIAYLMDMIKDIL